MVGPIELDFDGFQPQAVDKVIRLLTVLDVFGADPMLGSAVCLHGGTALNLFVLGMPRLSIDIDLNYVGSTDLETLQAARPSLEQRVIDAGENMGFDVTAGKPEHSGRSLGCGTRALSAPTK